MPVCAGSVRGPRTCREQTIPIPAPNACGRCGVYYHVIYLFFGTAVGIAVVLLQLFMARLACVLVCLSTAKSF